MDMAVIWITGATDDGSIIVHGLPGTEVSNRRVRLQRHDRERLAWDQEVRRKRAVLARWDGLRLKKPEFRRRRKLKAPPPFRAAPRPRWWSRWRQAS